MDNILLISGNSVGIGGDTRFTVDLYKHLRKNNNVKVIFNSSVNKKMIQTNPHNMIQEDAIYFDFKSEYMENLDNYDLCIITTVPHKTKHKDLIKDNFINLLKKIHCKKVFLEVGHNTTCYNCTMYHLEKYQKEFFDNIDLVVAHTNNGMFSKYMKKYNINKPLKEALMVATDYDKLSSEINKLPKVDGLVYFAGRPCVYKGLYKIFDFHKNWLMKNNFCTVYEGGNTGPRVYDTVYKDKETRTPYDYISLNLKNEEPYNFTNRGGSIQFNGEYIRMEMLSRMSQAKFGCFFSYFDKADEGGPFENVFNEIICCGVIPIVLKEFYETAHINRFYIKDEDPKKMGILIYDTNNPQKLIDKMIEIDNNEELFNQYINNSYNYFKSKLNSDIILDNLIKQF